MNSLNAWLASQVRREEGVVRLEDALLANRFGRYFYYRLRFLVARTAISTVFHAAKVVLLLGAFPRSEFLVIVVMQGSVALVGDFWWGALEQLRAEIRTLQRRAARHVIPREIARWLTLAARLAVGIGSVAALYAVSQAVAGRLGAVDALIVALVIGAALDLVSRTYHSGAYALRRVYRPLPSLLALDVVSVGSLLALWPFIGIWAFPVAELLSIAVVFSISIHYTSRTYRTLAIPTILPLLLLRLRAPSLRALRSAFAPAVSYALVGLEALVVIAGIATARTAAGATLVILLAALAPVSRASFEWARLLYFDLKRMEMPLLANLRARFERAVFRLALVIGLGSAALAAIVGTVLVPGATTLLAVALVALFTVRSLLAAGQMQAFTRAAYVRLTLAGAVGVAGVLATFVVTLPADLRIVAVAASLALSLLVLLRLPRGTVRAEALLPLADWLAALRHARGPVTVTKLAFDERLSSRGTTAEARRAEAWRRKTVANRLAARVGRRGGAAAWAEQHELWFFEPAKRAGGAGEGARGGVGDRADEPLRLGAGLLDSSPDITDWSDPRAAAQSLVSEALVAANPTGDSRLLSPAALVAEFARRFQNGIAYDTDRPAPAALAALSGRRRVEIYRAALLFVRGIRRGRDPQGLDVTALAVDGALRVIFVIDRAEDARTRGAWRQLVRELTLRAAAGVSPSSSPGPAPEHPKSEADQRASEVAML